jgi:hypothetical protein
MYFLVHPIIAFKRIYSRVELRDGVAIVVSVGITLLGLSMARLASSDQLDGLNVARATIDVLYLLALGWFGLASLGFLMADVVGAKLHLRNVLALAGLAATPNVLTGLVAILISIVFGPSVGCDWIFWVQSGLLWLGAILGMPGVYFALALHSAGRIPRITAFGISAILLSFLVFVFVLHRYVLLQ